ncbi:MAG: hypothetical protein ACTSRK_07840 [Promethearchaeota archaeon]
MGTFNNKYPNLKIITAQLGEIFESTAIFQQENEFPHKLFQIPIINLTCDLADFQHLWQQIYHIIMNTDGNALDIIVDGKHKIIFASLLRTTEKGNFLEAESLKVNNLPISDIHQLSLADTFEKFSPWIKKQYKIEIGNVRVYSDKFMEKIDEILSEGAMHPENFIDQVVNLFTLFSQASGTYDSHPENNLFFECFPSTAFSQFTSSFSQIIRSKTTSTFKDQSIGFLKRCIPQIKSTLSFQVENAYISYLFNNSKAVFQPKYLPQFNFDARKDENAILQRNRYLREMARKQKSSWNRFMDHTQVIRLIEAVLHSPFPLNIKRIELLLQMYLEFYRAYQFQWDIYPTPAIFNEQLRYVFNAMKIPLNLRKIAYWRAPRFILGQCLQNVGLNGSIFIVFGSDFKNISRKSSDSWKNSLFVMKIQLSKGEIAKIDLLSGKELQNSVSSNISMKSDSIEEFFQKMRVQVSSSSGYINSLYWISSDMVKTWLRVMNFEIFSSRLGAWRKLKSLVNMAKSPVNFGIAPKTALYTRMLSDKSGNFLKELLPLLIELREF